jgi:hypothetical protein
MEYFKTFSTLTFLNEFRHLAAALLVEQNVQGSDLLIREHHDAMNNLETRLSRFYSVPPAAHAIAISLVNLNANAQIPKYVSRANAVMLLNVLGIQNAEQALPPEDGTDDYWKDVSAVLTNNGVCFRDWGSEAFVAVSGLIGNVFSVLCADDHRGTRLSHVMPLVPQAHALAAQAVGSTVLNHILFYDALDPQQYPEFKRTLDTGSTRKLLGRTGALQGQGQTRDMNASYASCASYASHAGTNHPLSSLVNVLSSVNASMPRGHPLYLIGHEAILCRGEVVPRGYIKLSEYEARRLSRVTLVENFFAAARGYFKLYTDIANQPGKQRRYPSCPDYAFDAIKMTIQEPIAWKVLSHMAELSASHIIDNFVTYARMKGVVVVAKDVSQFYVRCTFDDVSKGPFEAAIVRKTDEYREKPMNTAFFADGSVVLSSSMDAIDRAFFEIATACEDLNLVRLLFNVKIRGGTTFHKIGSQNFTNNRELYRTQSGRFRPAVFWSATFKSFDAFPSASLLPEIGILDTYMCHTNSYITKGIHASLANFVATTQYSVRSLPDPRDVTWEYDAAVPNITGPPSKSMKELGLAYPTFIARIRGLWMRNGIVPAEPHNPHLTDAGRDHLFSMVGQYSRVLGQVSREIWAPNVANDIRDNMFRNVLHSFLVKYNTDVA